jgi:hypothetical protein
VTTSAPERTWRTDEPERRHGAAITVAVVTGVVVALVAAVVLWQRWDARAPYGPEQVDAHVTMSLVPEAQAQAAVDALAGGGVMTIPVGRGPLLVGRVTFDVPAEAREGDSCSLFLLDARQNLPLTQVFGVSAHGEVGQGWAGSYDTIATQVPWLSGIASVKQSDGGTTSAGMALSWDATSRGPITFVAVPLEGMLDPATLSSYTVGLTLQRGDGTLLWAQHLEPTAP